MTAPTLREALARVNALSALAVAPNGGAVEVGATEALRGAQIEDSEEGR